MLYERKVFEKLAHIVPALIIMYLSAYFFKEYENLVSIIEKAILVYIIFISIRVITSFFNGLHDIYQSLPISKDRPIKSYIQIAIIFIYLIGTILILKVIFGLTVSKFFTGLGALAAVLMLVFKDSILGLVGGLQLSANDMVRPGDWIVADDDGVMVLPSERAVEMANRAADVVEAENRIRAEIREQNTTLAKVVNLQRWEKKGVRDAIG